MLPKWVQSQQSAEMWAVIQGVKLAVNMGLKAVHIVADNLAAIWPAIRLTGGGGGLPGPVYSSDPRTW